MKSWLLPCLLVLATGCSHSASSTDAKATTPAPAVTSAPPADSASASKPKATKKIKTSLTASTKGERTLCKSASDQREILVVAKNGGCEVEYTKAQEMKVIASADHETSHCQEVVQKVRGHLESAGYTCN